MNVMELPAFDEVDEVEIGEPGNLVGGCRTSEA